MECIRPKLYWEVGASEQGADGVCDGEVSPFNGTILIGCISAGGAKVVAKFREECADEGISIEFSALVKDYVFVSALGCMLGEEVAKP